MSGTIPSMPAASRGPSAEAFIEANTRVLPVPHVPEIRLRMADEAVALWQLTESELAEARVEPPFWAFPWGGGQALARWVLNHAGELRARRVVDFASGSGLVGIAAAMAGATHVSCIDIDPLAAVAARLNAGLNGVELEARTLDAIGHGLEALGDPGIVLVGDVHYDRGFADRVTPWLEELARAGSRVVVGDPGRTYFPHGRGWPRLARTKVPVLASLEDAGTRTVSIHEVRPAGPRP